MSIYTEVDVVTMSCPMVEGMEHLVLEYEWNGKRFYAVVSQLISSSSL